MFTLEFARKVFLSFRMTVYTCSYSLVIVFTGVIGEMIPS